MNAIEKSQEALSQAEKLVEQGRLGDAVDKALEANAWAAVAAEASESIENPVRVMNDVSQFFHMLVGE